MSAPARAPLDSRAVGLMVFLCSLWGFTHVATKLAAPDISVVMQSGIRSAMSTALLWA